MAYVRARGHRHARGILFIELMIVVGIVALLTAAAIPHFRQARLTVNEQAATESLRAIVVALQSFRATQPGYPSDLGELRDATPPYLNPKLASGTRQGYVFTYTPSEDTDKFLVTAEPEMPGVTGRSTFVVDEGGVIRPLVGGPLPIVGAPAGEGVDDAPEEGDGSTGDQPQDAVGVASESSDVLY